MQTHAYKPHTHSRFVSLSYWIAVFVGLNAAFESRFDLWVTSDASTVCKVAKTGRGVAVLTGIQACSLMFYTITFECCTFMFLKSSLCTTETIGIDRFLATLLHVVAKYVVTERQTDRQTDRQMDRRTDGKTNHVGTYTTRYSLRCACAPRVNNYAWHRHLYMVSTYVFAVTVSKHRQFVKSYYLCSTIHVHVHKYSDTRKGRHNTTQHNTWYNKKAALKRDSNTRIKHNATLTESGITYTSTYTCTCTCTCTKTK